MSMYQKTYLGFINPPVIIATILPFICCFLVFHLLGMHDKIIWYISGFCAFLGNYYLKKLNLDIFIWFINVIIGIFLTPFALMLIELLTGISLY